MKIGSLPGYLSTRVQLFVLVFICIVFYANTLNNQFALDDIVVLNQNKYVKKGFSGIYNILTKDSFYGHYGQATHLAGGRWRPLSLVVFALEYPLLGDNPIGYHFNNLLLYTLCCLVLFALLRVYIFKDNHLAAFFAALLFAIHPIHTEAVANVKSLDELLSLLLLLTALYFSLKYINEGRHTNHLIIALAAYFLALLSKENGITFFFLLPVTFYCFTKENVKKAIVHSLPYFAVGSVYLFIRYRILGTPTATQEILNAPFLYASSEEKIATKLYVLGKYFLLLFFPHPLSYDYSYKQIPYVIFSNVYVICSIVLYIVLAALGIYGLRKRSILAYIILFYLTSISIVSNLIVDIGGVMGDRFLFQPSVGLVICLGLLLSYASSTPLFRTVTTGAIVIVTVVCGYIVVNRNADWYSNETLFLHDVKVAPASIKANYFAGIALINSADKEKEDSVKTAELKESLMYFKKAAQIDTTVPEIFLNEGVSYSRLNDLDNAEKSWMKAKKISPNNVELKKDLVYLADVYTKKAMEEANKKDYNKAIYYASKALQYDSLNVPLWYNLGAQYYNLQNYAATRQVWQKAAVLDTSFAPIKEGLRNLSAMGK